MASFRATWGHINVMSTYVQSGLGMATGREAVLTHQFYQRVNN